MKVLKIRVIDYETKIENLSKENNSYKNKL